MLSNTFLLRFAVSIILLVHSVPGMFDGGVTGFGSYLNESGWSPCGVPLAWLIKLSHIGAAVCLLANKWIRIAGGVTIFILIMGIIMVHYKEGWFVVGGGRNGMEFNFLLIFVLLAIMFPRGVDSSKSENKKTVA
ncbi:DoxX family protein [Niabella pedocola]|uniref:DoxX family protein n=1 Tax=Niabella pedocola TaxID=1752077 RepID=A0ABS8PUN1_9BACT|nr:DoxX family protein [Niabella pedocola]MCD2423998.1 DoxX family protein [Niabella pedocola]